MGSPKFPLSAQEKELKADEEAGPSSQGSTEPWDTTFNRAMNVYKERDKSALPTSAGRVSGFGTSMKFLQYYSTDTETRKERRKSSKDKEVVELKKKVESLEQENGLHHGGPVSGGEAPGDLTPWVDGGVSCLERGRSIGADTRAQLRRQHLQP